MAWELLAIWVIVVATVNWFVRDERRLRAEAMMQRAARYYAHVPRNRHVSADPVAPPLVAPRPRTGGLSAEQRAFMAAFTGTKTSA